MKRALVATLLLWSCSSGGSAIPDDDGPSDGPGKDGAVASLRREIKGGSRLKAKWFKGEDGSEIAGGLFDTKLNTECAFEEAEDGKPRCLPTPMAEHYWPNFPGFSVAITLYLDGACTQRAAVSSLCAPPRKFARLTDSCGSRTRVAPITEVPGGRIYYKAMGTPCGTGPDPAQVNMRVYSVGQALAVTEFVLGESTME